MINLKELAKQYPNSLDNAEKLKAYLTDLFPNENKKLISAIVEAYDCGIVEKIKKNPKPSDTTIISYCQKINKSGTYSESICRSSIDLWVDFYSNQVGNASAKTGKALFGLIRHTHKFIDSYVPPTCTSEGYTLHRCKCGESYKDNIVPKTEHTWSVVSRIEPSCVKDGNITYRCSKCGDQYSDVIAKVPHHYSIVNSKKVTCHNQGYMVYRCSVCGYVYTDIVPKTEHTWSVVSRIEPSCVKDGNITYRCSKCGDQYSDVIAKVPHRYSIVDSKEATCNNQGYNAYRCSTCGNEYVTTIPALVHDFSSWVPSKSKLGYVERQCFICKIKEYKSGNCLEPTEVKSKQSLEQIKDSTSNKYDTSIKQENDIKLAISQLQNYINKFPSVSLKGMIRFLQIENPVFTDARIKFVQLKKDRLKCCIYIPKLNIKLKGLADTTNDRKEIVEALFSSLQYSLTNNSVSQSQDNCLTLDADYAIDESAVKETSKYSDLDQVISQAEFFIHTSGKGLKAMVQYLVLTSHTDLLDGSICGMTSKKGATQLRPNGHYVIIPKLGIELRGITGNNKAQNEYLLKKLKSIRDAYVSTKQK